MKIKDIQVGNWYRTVVGDGVCLSVGGTHPPTAKFNILRPFPRGICFLKPREVIERLPTPPEEANA